MRNKEKDMENDTLPAIIVHPGEIVAMELAARDIKIADFDPDFQRRLWDVIENRTPITLHIATMLKRITGISEPFWFNLETTWRKDAMKVCQQHNDRLPPEHKEST
jgi:plasmid maintenance system antidote protein VapI